MGSSHVIKAQGLEPGARTSAILHKYSQQNYVQERPRHLFKMIQDQGSEPGATSCSAAGAASAGAGAGGGSGRAWGARRKCARDLPDQPRVPSRDPLKGLWVSFKVDIDI